MTEGIRVALRSCLRSKQRNLEYLVTKRVALSRGASWRQFGRQIQVVINRNVTAVSRHRRTLPNCHDVSRFTQ